MPFSTAIRLRPAERLSSHLKRNRIMLSWALTFFILAIVAAIFGFGGIAAGAQSIAQVLFLLFVVMFVVSLITGQLRRSRV